MLSNLSCAVSPTNTASTWTSKANDRQLRSLGFYLLHFDYPTIIEAFRTVGIDARYDEKTSDTEFAGKQRKWDRLSSKSRDKVWQRLLKLNAEDIEDFMGALERAVSRRISAVRVIPLHGAATDCASVQEAIDFVQGYSEDKACEPLLKYEVQIRYNNGDKVDGCFHDKETVIDFLEHYGTGNWTPIASGDEADAPEE